MGIYSSCPVLTGLEVTGWLGCVVGRMRHVSPGVAHARPTAGRTEKGSERGIERERECGVKAKWV